MPRNQEVKMESSIQASGNSDENTPDSTVDVSIVIPCLNESQVLPYYMTLANGLKSLLMDKLGLTCEVVVSDNGSTDSSGDIAASHGARVVFCQERGYGNALRFGIENAYGKYIVMGDADGSYDFKQALPMIEKLENGADVCMGSRFKGGIEKGAMPWKNRYIGNPVLTGILNLFFKSGISDAHCGLRAFTKDAYKKISPSSAGMEFASELVIKASLLKLKMTEIPITLYVDQRDKAPHLRPWRDGWRHLRYLIMLSPLWLFFMPAAVLLISASLLYGVLIQADGEVVRFGSIWIGDHWAVIASGMLSVGQMLLFFGLFVTLYGIKEGYRHCRKRHLLFFKICQLEIMIMFGLALFGLSGGLFLFVLNEWGEGNYQGLSMIRELSLSMAFFVMGVQAIASGFLMSTLSGNESVYKKLKKS